MSTQSSAGPAASRTEHRARVDVLVLYALIQHGGRRSLA